jgi:hypothetical protein
MAVCAITAAIVSGAAGVSVAFDDACAVTGEVTFDSLTAAPDQVGLLFDGTSAACSDGSATLGAATARLTGTFSCLTGNGTGTLAMRWLDGSVSSAPATLASVAAGVAVLGAFESGPYEGDAVSATLAVAAPPPGCSSARSTSAPGHGTVYIHPGPLVMTGAVGVPAVPPDEDAWGVKDEAQGSVDRHIDRCAVPGDMYHGDDSLCKYAQGWVGTRCTRTRTVVTGGSRTEKVCEQKQMVQFAYRGGTSSSASPKTSRCAYSMGHTDTEKWRLDYFRLVEESTNATRYAAPASHSALHYNCDTDGPRFYGTPSPVTMDSDYRAEFRWFLSPCGHPRPCQITDEGFLNWLTFGIGVPS